MATNNQGIMHLRLGGWESRNIACKRRDAIMATIAANFDAEPRKCVRCMARWEKMKAAEDRRAAKTAA